MRVVVALDGRGEDSGDIQRLEFGVGGLVSRPYGGEQGVVFDGGVDRGSGEQGMEAAATRGFVVFLQEGLADGAFSAEASSSLVFLRLELAAAKEPLELEAPATGGFSRTERRRIFQGGELPRAPGPAAV